MRQIAKQFETSLDNADFERTNHFIEQSSSKS